MDDYVVVDTNAEFRKLLKTVFSDAFMKKYTTFENFEGFQYSSAVMTNWEADQMIYSRAVFDNFVKESTQFSSWDQMVMTAADEAFGTNHKKQ
ncbi:MAG: hypothetical protein HFE76_13870 [Firmicutes bacterium]|nr:hypothetical protein [Bacillota bacterium]